MSDIKLFRLSADGVNQLTPETVALEKSLQNLIEKHLDALLGVRFLASEYGTGKKHGGRIDTLSIDENGCPVIIEYKRNLNENVINQGLYYLDWLMDHQAEFKLLVMERLSIEDAKTIDWSSPRLVCIAGSYTKYDGYAVDQINRNIELIRYARYGDEFLMLDLINRVEATDVEEPASKSSKPMKSSTTNVSELLDGMGKTLTDVWAALKEFLIGLGTAEEVTIKETKLYVAFRRLKNFVCVRPTGSHLILWIKVDPDSIRLEDGFTRDVRKIGHYGTGDLEVLLSNMQDFERAKPLLLRSFEDN